MNWNENPIVTNIIQKVPETILLGYGGSYAYGTNVETSDIDVRGIYMNPLDELIGCKADSETKEIEGEDTVLYSLKKMLHLLSQCNPNTIEILGLKGYLYMTNIGQEILENKQIFLSKKAIMTFGQYAKAQLNRLINKSGRAKEEIRANELRSLQKMYNALYHDNPFMTASFMEGNGDEPHIALKGIASISEFCKFAKDVETVHTDYKTSLRNNKAIEHSKLSKHMMHLIRLYMMGIDILEEKQIITYREKEHDLLMDIRNGKYLEADLKTPTKEFEKLLLDYQKKFDEVASITTLPDKPDMEAINNLMMKCVKMYYGMG